MKSTLDKAVEQQEIFTVDQFNAKFKKNKNTKKEEKVQIQVCNYLKKKYPQVIFTCDLASGLRLPIWMGALHKKMRSSRGMPDLFIAAVHVDRKGGMFVNKMYSGLFLELKKEGVRKKDGTLPAAWREEKIGGVKVKYDHHKEQSEILERLTAQGYRAEFACGYDEAVKIIDEYLG